MWSWWSHVRASRGLLMAVLTPLVLMPLPIILDRSEANCAYVLVVMAVYWITETVPLAVTALVPVILFPMMGVMTASDTSKAYISDTIMLGLGGLSVAIGVERWNLHKRIALRILLIVGSEPRWLMLGMMGATWFLSMWISNTATTAMMIPITEAILQQLSVTNHALDEAPPEGVADVNDVEMVEVTSDDDAKARGEKEGDTNKNFGRVIIENGGTTTESKTKKDEDTSAVEEDVHFKRLCTGMSLCVCYAANSGGIATLTGTGPNLIVKGFADELYQNYGEKNPINFATWMGVGFPLSALMVVVCWIWLQIVFLRCRGACDMCRRNEADKSDVHDRVTAIVRNEYNKLGPISFAEGSMLFWFILMVVLWISQDLGGEGGWQDIFPDGYVSGSTVSITITVILHFYPSTPPAILTGRRVAERHVTRDDYVGVPPLQPLLTWDVVQKKMPWGLVLLLGGGFALAQGCEVSGLSQWIGEKLEVFSHLDRWGMAFILCYITAATTEVTSNSAISTLLMPILSSLALSTGVHPLYYLFAGTIASSFAFMLPVATPPNAVVFSYGRVTILEMMSTGFVLNLLAVPCLVLALGTWGDAIFDFQNPPSFFFPNNTQSSQLLSVV